MKGFIEVESQQQDGKVKELMNVNHIISVCGGNILVNAIDDNGYTQGSHIVFTTHTYDEIKQKIVEAIEDVQISINKY